MALLFWLFFGRLTFGPSSAQDRVGLLQETTALPFVGKSTASPIRTGLRPDYSNRLIGMLSCIAIFPFERDLYFHGESFSTRRLSCCDAGLTLKLLLITAEHKSSARHSVLTFLLAYTVQETIVSIISSFVSRVPLALARLFV